MENIESFPITFPVDGNKKKYIITRDNGGLTYFLRIFDDVGRCRPMIVMSERRFDSLVFESKKEACRVACILRNTFYGKISVENPNDAKFDYFVLIRKKDDQIVTDIKGKKPLWVPGDRKLFLVGEDFARMVCKEIKGTYLCNAELLGSAFGMYGLFFTIEKKAYKYHNVWDESRYEKLLSK